MSLSAPLWLILLGLLPLIRWLHRGGRHRRAWAVSRLALWRDAAAAAAANAERRPPDPAWRRRAWLAAVLALTLAGPQWLREPRHIVLWIDDSASMLTRELQGTRLAVGLALARARLAEVQGAEVEMRTLGNPWRRLDAPTEASAAAIAAAAGLQTPAPPPAALLRRDARHWLVTDAAHAAVLAWPDGTRAEYLIQVGRETRNVGIERVAARRRPGDPAGLDLLVRVANGGTQPETRQLVAVDAGASERARLPLRLEPAASIELTLAVPAAAALTLRLEPTDVLAEDDRIGLDLAPLVRRRVAVDPQCPPPLVRAVATHPGLVSAPAADATLALDCGRAPGVTLPTLRVHSALPALLPQGPLRWSSAAPAAHRPQLQLEWLRAGARLEVDAGDRVWLASGDTPLIVARDRRPPVIETTLEFSGPATAAGMPTPLLLNWLLEKLLDESLLDPIVVVDRGAGAARIVPATGGHESPPPAGLAGRPVVHDGSRWLLIVAALLLLWEVAALGAQWRRLRVPADRP